MPSLILKRASDSRQDDGRVEVGGKRDKGHENAPHHSRGVDLYGNCRTRAGGASEVTRARRKLSPWIQAERSVLRPIPAWRAGCGPEAAQR
jgi:hypothetical protein